MTVWPDDKLIVILDNLSVHRSQAVQLWSLANPRIQFLFQPTYTPWLNLIEPWWKTLRNLALKGRRFDDIDSLHSSVVKATNYWNAHRKPYRWLRTFPEIKSFTK